MFRNKDYIYCVYKEQSFGKAAEKLHVSQPALSAMVKRTETQLGAPVFDRKTSPISLTPFGVEYIRNIEIVNELESQLQNMTYELQTLQSGQLSICASNLSTDSIITEMIAGFKKKYPKVNLNVIGANTYRSKQMLDSREIDLFITAQPLDEREYKRFSIAKEQLILVVPKENEINVKFKDRQLTRERINNIFDGTVKGIPLSAFQELPFILPNNGNYLRSCTDTLFREARFEPKLALEVEESVVSLNFAKFGVGATICNYLLIERTRFEDHFCLYKLDSQYAHRCEYVCYRTGTYVTPAMAKFLENAKKQPAATAVLSP